MKKKNIFQTLTSAVTSIDWSRVGKELKKHLSEIDGRKIISGSIKASSLLVIGALSRQPEINKVKSENKELFKENDNLREAVRTLNQFVNKIKEQLQALKAYSLVEEAKKTEELKGCIKYQYATKEYIELAIQKLQKEKELSKEDQLYMELFSSVLNGELLEEEEMEIIEQRVDKKYGSEIENLIEFDCLILLRQLEQ